MEYELKYAATPENIPEALAEDPRITAAAVSDWAEIPMATTYYDLPGEALRAQFITLRCRQEGPIRRVTLKTRTKIAHARGEWEVEALDLAEGLPKLLEAGSPRLPEDAALYHPTCGAEFLRRAILLQLDGCKAELAVDRGRLFRENRELFFSEIELELKEGTPEAMEALGLELCRDYGLHEETRGKFTRAVSL